MLRYSLSLTATWVAGLALEELVMDGKVYAGWVESNGVLWHMLSDGYGFRFLCDSLALQCCSCLSLFSFTSR